MRGILDITAIINFKCPRWNQLPETPMFNRDVVEYINQILSPIFDDQEIITSTIIQNYSKRSVIPKLKGRKYDRSHIAYLIIISIYKQILNIEQVSYGVGLQLNLMHLNEGYDIFAEALERALRITFMNVKDKANFFIPEQRFDVNTEGVQVIANAFAMKLLGIKILQAQGFRKVGEKNE